MQKTMWATGSGSHRHFFDVDRFSDKTGCHSAACTSMTKRLFEKASRISFSQLDCKVCPDWSVKLLKLCSTKHAHLGTMANCINALSLPSLTPKQLQAYSLLEFVQHVTGWTQCFWGTTFDMYSPMPSLQWQDPRCMSKRNFLAKPCLSPNRNNLCYKDASP